jgi:hypothetical protein
MAQAIVAILQDDVLRRRLSANAARDASVRFDLDRQLTETETWYREARQDWTERVARSSQAAGTASS